MEGIKMLDLYSQYVKIQEDLDKALHEVINATAFIKGPQVKSFEQSLAKYLSCKKVIGCGNGTDALQIALMALNLPQGAEVITSDFTFVATAEVIALLGLKPVLVDINPNTFNISSEAISEAITEKTRAVIPVHLFGQCADMKQITDIVKDKNIAIIEDTAQALGSDYIWPDKRRTKAGTIGDMGTTSFFPSKNLGCMGDGGAIMTNDMPLAEAISLIYNHGMGQQYYYERIGINSRLDTLQAAILEVKLKHLDDFNGRRRQSAYAYNERLKDVAEVECPVEADYSTHIYHQYTIKVKGKGKREKLMRYLNEKGIPTKIYYPVPLHVHKPYQDYAHYDVESLQNTISVSKEVMSLPMHTELPLIQVDYICDAIKNYCKKEESE